MLTPMIGNVLPDGVTWAVDTGCFAAPERFDPLHYLDWLWQRLPHAHRCLFATAPDVYGDGPATLTVATPMLPLIRIVGYRAALVVQPGVTVADLDWDAFDAVFAGGPDDWHTSADLAAIVAEARRRGKWCHRGRVNSLKRLRASQVMGYDSADGTFLAFGPDTNMPRLKRWVETIAAQPTLAI